MISDVCSLITDLLQYLSTIRYPGAALSLRVSDVYSSLNYGHGMTQIISRIMYHAVIRSYSIDSHGRQQLNMLDFELLRNGVGEFICK